MILSCTLNEAHVTDSIFSEGQTPVVISRLRYWIQNTFEGRLYDALNAILIADICIAYWICMQRRYHNYSMNDFALTEKSLGTPKHSILWSVLLFIYIILYPFICLLWYIQLPLSFRQQLALIAIQLRIHEKKSNHMCKILTSFTCPSARDATWKQKQEKRHDHITEKASFARVINRHRASGRRRKPRQKALIFHPHRAHRTQ